MSQYPLSIDLDAEAKLIKALNAFKQAWFNQCKVNVCQIWTNELIHM